MVDILPEMLREQGFRDLGLYMYVEIGGELFENRYGPGVMPVTMTTDVIGEIFNWPLPGAGNGSLSRGNSLLAREIIAICLRRLAGATCLLPVCSRTGK